MTFSIITAAMTVTMMRSIDHMIVAGQIDDFGDFSFL